MTDIHTDGHTYRKWLLNVLSDAKIYIRVQTLIEEKPKNKLKQFIPESKLTTPYSLCSRDCINKIDMIFVLTCDENEMCDFLTL